MSQQFYYQTQTSPGVGNHINEKKVMEWLNEAHTLHTFVPDYV